MTIKNTTLLHVHLGIKTARVFDIKFDTQTDPMLFLVCLYDALIAKDSGYLTFDDWVDQVYNPDPKIMYGDILRGGKNLVTMPLGYDGTSQTVLFVNTMFHTYDVEEIDLTNCKMPKLYGYMQNGELNFDMEYQSEIVTMMCSSYYMKLLNLRKTEREAALESRDKVAYAEIKQSIKDEYDKIVQFVEQQPDDVEFEFDEYVFVKNVVVDLELLKMLAGKCDE